MSALWPGYKASAVSPACLCLGQQQAEVGAGTHTRRIRDVGNKKETQACGPVAKSQSTRKFKTIFGLSLEA